MNPSKYHAVKTVVNGLIFDSKAEARRYEELYKLEQTGVIKSLRVHPRYRLQDSFECDGVKYAAIDYVADFEYVERTGERITVEDVKGVETPVFKVKQKLFLRRYGDVYKFIIKRG
jgi:hypothetical protein